MYRGYRIGVVIPALNEGRSIALVVAAIPRWVDAIVVVDNGSSDDTASKACAAGATVVVEPTRGYGAACQTGVAALPPSDAIVFLDADFSDDPSEMERLLLPITDEGIDLVIGSRTTGTADPGALTPQQRLGNGLACFLIKQFWGVAWTDLGPFRAIRTTAYQRLGMRDRAYGWTVEMQVKAAALNLRSAEVPVRYRCRIGVSKISGTLSGSIKAGATILTVITRLKLSPRGR